MVFAEKYTFKAERFVMDLQIEIARDEGRHVARIRLDAWAAQFGQEFKQPRFDHCPDAPSRSRIHLFGDELGRSP